MKRRDFLKSATVAAVTSGVRPLWAGSALQALGDQPVQRVLVVFMCHLDIGFTDTQANVLRTYFQTYYPQAIAQGSQSRAAGGDRYRWTTFPWLLYEYLEQATAGDRNTMEQAVLAGDIAYHALPFNWQTEMLDRSMIEGCLGFAATLDRRFGLKTVGGKMTDVPGHSRGLVPPLAAAGVTLLDIGVNPASTPPEVPDVFRWQDPNGSAIAVLYHKHDYGGLIRVPNSDLAISVQMRVDNTGPHTPAEVVEIYKTLRQQFPAATVEAANFSEVANAVAPFSANLPVITQEIGDTWIYGVASDPPKIARYREAARLRKQWIGASRFQCGDHTDLQLLRRLPLAVEHTWGTDTKRYIDHKHYPPAELAKYLAAPGYRTMEHSWQEKRDDIDQGIANLPAAWRNEAVQRLESLKPRLPDHAGMHTFAAHKTVRTPHFEIAFDPKTGAIQHLSPKHTKKLWASPEHPLALFSYQTLTQSDYKAFLAAYVLSKAWWAPQDFGKPNIEQFPAESRIWTPSLKNQWEQRRHDEHRIVLELAIEDEQAQMKGLVAWPQSIWMEVVLPDAEPVVHLSLSTFGKVANRMPEAMWLSFHPQTTARPRWSLTKVDETVDPMDVIRGGARRMHAVTEDCICHDAEQQLQIATLDAPVVAFSPESPLNFSQELPDMHAGVHIGLYNNAWGTNYPQWAAGDWNYRVTLRPVTTG